MYRRCLVCGARFPEGKVLKHLPRGDRVAYDIQRGRLWVVCRGCRRWSLVPLEARWEALEELEGLISGRQGGPKPVRLLSRTESVALYSLGSLEVVRVGDAEIAEEAWWRYGRPLWPGVGVAPKLPRPTPWLKANGVVWKGRRACPGCGHVFTEIPFSERNILIVRPAEDPAQKTRRVPHGPEEGPSAGEALAVARRCPRCRDVEQGGLHLRGVEAELILFRLLAFEYHRGAPMDRVRAAVRLAQDPGGPATLVRILTRYGRPLGDLPPLGTLALEMVVNDAREQSLSRMEAKELELRWRREEELAALVDGELTPLPLLLLRRILPRV